MKTLSTDAGTDRLLARWVGEDVRYGKLLWKGFAHGVLLLASFIAVAPFAWAFLTSLKEPGTVFTTIGIIFPRDPTLTNYASIWTDHAFDRWVMNSLIITTGGVFLSLFVDSLAGFALAKGEFRGRWALFMIVLGTLVIPPQAVMVPLYLEMSYFNLINTYWAIIVLFVAGPFGTFMMRQFYLTIPDSLLEASRMDGCSMFQTYLRIMLPMGKPALSSLAVFKFTFVWGAFLWPLIVIEETAMFPLQVGIGLLTGQYGQSAWGQILAAAILAALPVITAYMFAQRTFMEGIALSGGKG